jgi:hypothetical protein
VTCSHGAAVAAVVVEPRNERHPARGSSRRAWIVHWASTLGRPICTALHSRCRSSPSSLGLSLLRRLQELVYNMRVGLDFLRASTLPAFLRLAHVRIFWGRLRGEDELAVFT